MGTEHEQDPYPDPTVRAEGHDRAQMPILGAGIQHNTFAGHHPNADVVLVLTHEQSRIESMPGRTSVFSLEITNRDNRSRRLTLRPVGVPESVCAITPATMVVRPNATVRAKVILQPRPASPEAGERELSVEAIDADTNPATVRWMSNRKGLRILPRPDLTLNVAKPPERYGQSTTYRTSVKVTNTGNTRLSGTLHAPSILWIMSNTKVDPGRRFVDASLIRIPGEFELGPGTSADIPVSVTFPDEPDTDQRWDMLLRVKADRSGIDERVCSVPLVQVGRPEVVQIEPPVDGGPGEWTSWMSGRVAVPKILVVLAALAVLAAAAEGVFITTRMSPAPAAASVSPLASSEVALSAGPAPSADPPAVPLYTTMPCAPNTWVVFLSSFGGAEADRDTDKAMRYEARRARFVDGGRTYDIKASPWDQACPAARSYVGPHGDSTWRLVWIGPVTSKQKAQRICDRLEKPSPYDCLWRPTT